MNVRVLEDHIWLRALADLQAIKQEFEEAMNHISKIWTDHEDVKTRALSKLFVGQKHLIVVLYYMYLAIDKSPMIAFDYLKWIKKENLHLENFDRIVNRFDQACEVNPDDGYLSLDPDDINLPLAAILPSRDDFPVDQSDSSDADEDTESVQLTEMVDLYDDERNEPIEAANSEEGQSDAKEDHIKVEASTDEAYGEFWQAERLQNVESMSSELFGNGYRAVSDKSDSVRIKKSDKKRKPSHKCELCNKTFPLRSALFMHFSSIHQRELHACSLCDVIFENEHVCPKLPDATMKIMNVLSNLEGCSHSCYYCNEICSTKSKLVHHLKVHVSDAHVCNVCKKVMNCRDSLRKHYKLHHHRHRERIKYQCDSCGKLFLCRKLVQDHIEAHKGGERHVCEHCGMSFSYAYGLKKHQWKHDVELGMPKPHQCKVCNKPFRSKNELKRHQNRHTAGASHVCSICGKKVSTKAGLAMHMYYHKENAPTTKKVATVRFPCQLCDKSYSTQIQLKYHMRLHTGDSPYICQICGKICSEKGALNAHQKTHVKGDNFQCDVCGKWFANDLYLERHKVIHSDNTYPCTECDKVFNTPVQLYKHKGKKHRKKH